MSKILACSATLLLVASAGHATDRKSEGKPGTYAVGQVVNAHTLMVCNSKEHMLEVAAAYKVSDEAGGKKWAELEKVKTVLGDAACGRIDGSNQVRIKEAPVSVDSIGEGPDKETMTVVRLEAVNGGRTLWAMLFGDFRIVDRKAQIGSVPAGEASKRIAALKTKGGSDPWDDEVKEILLAAFDKDGSGEIDSDGELKAIPCDVWRTMDRSIRSGSKDSGLAWTYGFKPDYEWVGDAFAIAEKLRKATLARIVQCGVSDRLR